MAGVKPEDIQQYCAPTEQLCDLWRMCGAARDGWPVSKRLRCWGRVVQTTVKAGQDGVMVCPHLAFNLEKRT